MMITKMGAALASGQISRNLISRFLNALSFLYYTQYLSCALAMAE
jgi:hypothetical protein